MGSIGINIPNLVLGATEQILEANPDNYKSTVPGPQGIQGEAGRNVHHIVHDRSILVDGTVIAGIGRSDEFDDDEIGPGVSGNKDIYEAYADEDELSHVGEITVQNGESAYNYAIEGGFDGTVEEFIALLGQIDDLIADGEDAVEQAEEARDKAKLWAEEDEDVEVETDKYSALHYSAKAKASADSIQDAKDKLDGIEDGATADQTDEEIKTAYENNDDTNAYTDDEKTLVDVDTDLTTTATTLTTGVNELNDRVDTITGTTEW